MHSVALTSLIARTAGSKRMLSMGFVVAVTGGVASGKSAVTERFEALGVVVHDADLVARELVEPGRSASLIARMARSYRARVRSAH